MFKISVSFYRYIYYRVSSWRMIAVDKGCSCCIIYISKRTPGGLINSRYA